MAGLFNSTVEYNGKIENADVLIKAAAETLITVLKGAKEAMDEGRPCILKDGCIRPVNEPTEAESNTAYVDADVLESIHKLADALEKGRDAIPTTIKCGDEDFPLKALILDLTGSIHTLIRNKK